MTKTTITLIALATGLVGSRGAEAQALHERPQFHCGHRSASWWLEEFRRGVENGEIPDPATRSIPDLPPPQETLGGSATPCLTPAQVFAFEDTNQVLLTDFTIPQLIDLLVEAANALLAAHGDGYDFVGFWTNFNPHHTVGTAAYWHIKNDVLGIGDPTDSGNPLFDTHSVYGIAGERLEGGVIMYNINSSTWQPGAGPAAGFTRLALGQEYEHRFAMYLPDLLDGRVLQGNNASCGRTQHWSWRVDGQGSSMEIAEWVGANPAVLSQSFVSFNTDIPGSIFSYTDLYLMGYVSPAEMDAGNSELRFMNNNSNCSSTYFGAISSFSSADIIAAAGRRVPDHASEDHDYRTGWIMIHLPGDPPSFLERNKAVAIHEQHQIDWNYSTVGRGTMNNQVFNDCNCNGVPDAGDIDGGGSADDNGNGIPHECEPCSWDLDGSGDVGINDFIELLAAWGPNPGHPADFDGDGVVGIVDFLALLAAWGPCP